MIVGLRSKAGHCGPRLRGPYPVALLTFIALLGFAASAFAGVATTPAALSTTVPPPDPPRSTTPKPDVVPPAPPRHPRRPVVPPPPPRTVAPPPPAAVAPLSPTSAPTITQSRTTALGAVRPRSTKPRIETPPAARPRPRPRPPHLRERPVLQAPSSSALLAPRASSSSALPLLLLLVFAAGTSLLLVGVAVAPPWALPQRAFLLVSDRRETVAVAGVAVFVSTGLGVLLALMGT